jgi:hypothetical protein
MSPTTTTHVGGIHTIEKPRHIGHNPMLICRLYKGDHITHLCPTTIVVQEAWSSPGGPSGSKSSLVSQISNPSLVDTMICWIMLSLMPMV